MGVHRFARALDDMQGKVIVKQGCKSITDEVKVSKFLNNIPDIIKKSITPHWTHDMSCNDIITKSERFEAANRGADADYTKPGYSSEVSTYQNTTSTRSSYPSQQPRADKDQPQQNHLATLGARSPASAETKDTDRDKIKKTLTEKERMRGFREKVCSWCGLAVHNFNECSKRLNQEPMTTAAKDMQLHQPVGTTRFKEKTKQKPHVAIGEPLDPNRVFIKVNGHPALAWIDLQTIGGDLISAQFVYLYQLPVVKIEPKTLATTM